MIRFKQIFTHTISNVIGMIHVGALPGTPCYKGSVAKLIDTACEEAEIYKQCGIDGILIENMHDIPYIQPKDMNPEISAVMTAICANVRALVPPSIPCGVQILAGANIEAIAISLAANLQFIRAEGFIFSHIADEGWTNACAGPLLRYRHSLKADDILVFADIKKKHSAHAITADVSLQETVKAAEFFLSDGVILTGTSTGEPVNTLDLNQAKQCAKGPVIIGSGVTVENLSKYITADAIIIGSYFKEDGSWKNAVDPDKVKIFMEEVTKEREKYESKCTLSTSFI